MGFNVILMRFQVGSFHPVLDGLGARKLVKTRQ
jgi:hypothetical protein